MPRAILSNHALIRISGAEAEEFLANLVTCDIHSLRGNQIGAGALLSPQGKINWSFLIGRTDAGFLLEVAAQDASDFAKRLRFYRLRAKVDIAEPEMVSAHIIWGDDATNGDATNGDARRDLRFKSVAVFRSFGSADDPPVDAGWTALRIAHGVAEAHLDYAYGEMFPHDVNLDQIGGVAFAKGCYVGQEVVSRMHHRGTARRRVMVAQADEALQSGAAVFSNGRESGVIGSVSGITALAIVRLDKVKDAANTSVATDGSLAAVAFEFPADVTFSWPAASEEHAG